VAVSLGWDIFATVIQSSAEVDNGVVIELAQPFGTLHQSGGMTST
jgi:hypothetical protein